MTGLLIYDSVGKARNEWFINRLIESAKNLGHELKLVIYDGGDFSFDEVDFAIVRTINPNINKYFEERAIPTFNNAKTSEVANDKWQTYLFAKELGILTMSTKKPVSIEDAAASFDFPFVIKAVDGHGGNEVFLIDSKQKCEEIFTKTVVDKTICQKMCSEPGVDLRVYMLGGEVLAAAKRTSLSDFRSNFSLGGKAEIVPVPKEVNAVLKKVYCALRCDFVGVDFIRHNGEWVLNEIEDVVGTRMLYSLTDIDAARVYVEYVIKMLNSRK